MFTDVVGFTAAAQTNEAVALERLREQEDLVRPVFDGFGGREIKSTGDGFLVEFGSALKAVECAVEIQRRVRERNLRERGDPIELRVGIHVGDVEERQGDIFGDSVNVASRIVAIATPRGICLTGLAYDHIRGKVAFGLERVGPTRLKGVQEPVDVYRVILPWEGRALPAEEPSPRRIAILPLRNISPDSQDEYFADGLTEELISTLSKVRELSVISRTSVMQFKDRTKPITEIGRELRSGTILEGSVRKLGNRVRVNIEMVDAGRDQHLWSESYDRELQDVFAIQGDIAGRVATALKVELLASEKKDIDRRPTENVDAYQLCLQGSYHLSKDTSDEVALALRYFQDAIEIDRACAPAYTGVANCYHTGSHGNWYRPEEAYPRMKEFATKALEVDPRSADGHAALGAVYFHYEWRWDDAEKEFSRSIDLQPSSGDYLAFAFMLAILGRREEAAEKMRVGANFNPDLLETWKQAGVRSWGVVMFPERLPSAVVPLERRVQAHPGWDLGHLALGWGYYHASKPDLALKEMRTAVDLSPKDASNQAALGWLLALVGHKEEAESILEVLLETSSKVYLSQVRLACLLSALERDDEAFAFLEEAYRARAIDLPDVRLIPQLDGLRADPRWRSIEQRMGLSPLSQIRSG